MKNKILAILAIGMIVFCVLAPFYLSDLQNQNIINQTYFVQNKRAMNTVRQNLFEKINIYMESVQSGHVEYDDVYHIGSEVEDQSGSALSVQMVQQELMELQKLGIFPKTFPVNELDTASFFGGLQTHLSDDISQEAVLVWSLNYYWEEMDLGIVMKSESHKIVEIYLTETAFLVDSISCAERYGEYLGAEEIEMLGENMFCYRMENAEVIYCFDREKGGVVLKDAFEMQEIAN